MFGFLHKCAWHCKKDTVYRVKDSEQRKNNVPWLVTMRAIFPGSILARISILPKISRIWLCLRVQTDRCMTSVPYVFEMLSRYFESKQYRNPGQDASGKNGTYGHPSHDLHAYALFCCVMHPWSIVQSSSKSWINIQYWLPAVSFLFLSVAAVLFPSLFFSASLNDILQYDSYVTDSRIQGSAAEQLNGDCNSKPPAFNICVADSMGLCVCSGVSEHIGYPMWVCKEYSHQQNGILVPNCC